LPEFSEGSLATADWRFVGFRRAVWQWLIGGLWDFGGQSGNGWLEVCGISEGSPAMADWRFVGFRWAVWQWLIWGLWDFRFLM
jgi:hypothetical protein